MKVENALWSLPSVELLADPVLILLLIIVGVFWLYTGARGAFFAAAFCSALMLMTLIIHLM